MKNISIFQIVVLGVFVLVAGVGLFMFATYSGSSNNAASTGPIVIWGTLPKEAFDAVLMQGDKESLLASATYVEKQEDTFTDDYINAAASGAAPDLLVLSSDDLMALKHTLTLISQESIPERGFKDTFIDATYVLLTPEGVLGYPLAIDPLVLYYNRALLASSGIAEPPRTWEAVGAMVPQLALVTNQQTITRAAIALGGYANITHAREILTAFFIQAGVPLSQAKGGGSRNTFLTALDNSGTSPAEAALRYYITFANPAQTTYTWNSALPSARALFLSGDLALYIGSGSEYASLRQANPNLDFDVTRMPQPGNATLKSTYGKIYTFAIPKASKNPSGALSVAFSFTSAEAAQAFVGSSGNLASVRRDVVGARVADPIQTVINGEAIIARSWLSPDKETMDAIFGAMISNVTSGRVRLGEALSAAQRAILAAYPQ